MGGERVVVVGANRLGCGLALEGRKAGFDVILIDEHPQRLKTMSFDAPYFYGNGLPAALRNRVSAAANVLPSSELLLACAEREVDVRTGTVAWGVFQNGPNSLHIGTPQVGIVSNDGNEMIAYDHLVLATGSRDFVGGVALSQLALMGATNTPISQLTLDRFKKPSPDWRADKRWSAGSYNT